MIQLTLTLKMTTTQVVETSVTINNKRPIQDYVHLDDYIPPTYEMTPGFKPFTFCISVIQQQQHQFYLYATLIYRDIYKNTIKYRENTGCPYWPLRVKKIGQLYFMTILDFFIRVRKNWSLGMRFSGYCLCWEVAIIERSAMTKISCRCREVAIAERWPLV